MRSRSASPVALGLLLLVAPAPTRGVPPDLEVAGVTVTPHVRAEGLRYRRDPGRATSARVPLFLRNPAPEGAGEGAAFRVKEVSFNGQSPLSLVPNGDWAWHDVPSVWTRDPVDLPAGALTVWSFNGKGPRWRVGSPFRMAAEARDG